jgi:hypothetical protein
MCLLVCRVLKFQLFKRVLGTCCLRDHAKGRHKEQLHDNPCLVGLARNAAVLRALPTQPGVLIAFLPSAL